MNAFDPEKVREFLDENYPGGQIVRPKPYIIGMDFPSSPKFSRSINGIHFYRAGHVSSDARIDPVIKIGIPDTWPSLRGGYKLCHGETGLFAKVALSLACQLEMPDEEITGEVVGLVHSELDDRAANLLRLVELHPGKYDLLSPILGRLTLIQEFSGEN